MRSVEKFKFPTLAKNGKNKGPATGSLLDLLFFIF
jgi:hypothetical protein